jgi:hypothetical protein
MKSTPAEFLNVDLDLKSVRDPRPLLEAWGHRVIPIHEDKVGRRHWLRLELATPATSPEEAIRRFCALVESLPGTARAVWDTAASKEFDVGLQAAFNSRASEWVLQPRVVEAIAAVGARLRLTVYSPPLRIRESQPGKGRKTRQGAGAADEC